jgi:hypothetical protein
VCTSFEVTNLETGLTLSRTENPLQAMERVTNGRTITNEVFRAAMKAGALELENSITDEMSPCAAANIRSKVRTLRPKRFNQGLLVFGLLHQTVQERLKW